MTKYSPSGNRQEVETALVVLKGEGYLYYTARSHMSNQHIIRKVPERGRREEKGPRQALGFMV